MAIDASSIKSFLLNTFNGVVAGIGDASPPITLTERPDGQGTVALVREGYTAHRLEGQRAHARVHAFEDVASLAEWLKRHAKPEVAEVLVGEVQVLAALAPRDVHGDVVSCPLHLHPRWGRWSELLDKNVGQRDLHRFVLGALEDFAAIPVEGSTTPLNEGESIAGQIAKFEAIKTGEVKVEVDERGFVRFASVNEKTEVKGKLPPRFKIRVPMFLGIEGVQYSMPKGEVTYELEIHLQLDIGEKGAPIFTLACPNLEVVLRKARLDAVAWLRHLLGEEFLVGLGDLQLNSVPVVTATK